MAQWDQIDVDGSPMRLYVGMPSLGRAFPAVIVIQHGPGVDRFIQDRVETLSEQHGYLAIAARWDERGSHSRGENGLIVIDRIPAESD